MEDLRYVSHNLISMKSNPHLNEKWLQSRIAENPTILGLGDLILKDEERLQPKAGRLDLLLQDPDENLRYEVEIQLGPTDESHIIRTIEYWDIERRRYPQYDHVAVIAAEDITSRFLNVISLFNGFIPIIAIQINAIQVGEYVSLVSTRVLDQMTLGTIEEDEDQEIVDRSYWEKRASLSTIQMADEVLKIIYLFDPDVEFKYTKFYIGMAKSGQAFNFVKLRPQKTALRLEPRMSQSSEIDNKIEAAGLDLMDYHNRSGRYRLRLTEGEIHPNVELLQELLDQAHKEFNR